MEGGFLKRKKAKALKYISMVLIMSFTLTGSPKVTFGDTPKDKSNSETTNSVESIANDQVYEKYSYVRSQYKDKGYKPTVGAKIILDSSTITGFGGEDKPLQADIGGRKDVALNWKDTSTEWFEWTFEVSKEGLYEIDAEYYPLDGTGAAIQRTLMIDGKVPFDEANNIAFPRMWKDEGEPKTNNIGDEVWPKQVESKAWRTISFVDSQGMSTEPFQIYFSTGKHTLRLAYVDQPIAIGNIVVKSPEVVPTYAQVKAQNEQKGYKKATQSVKFQAETTTFLKSDPTIRRENTEDPKAEPRSIGSRKLNVMGGNRWKRGNQSISWKFDVPEDGLYRIDMRLNQNYAEGLPSFRQIKIDGKVPFEELKSYSFFYEREWRIESLHNAVGEPYEFYLTKGQHEITMVIKMGPIADIVQAITEDTIKMSETTRKITMITGTEPDPNYEYELDRAIPGLMDELKQLAESMDKSATKLIEISTKKPTIANSFIQIRDQLNSMIAKPDSIPRRLKDLENAQTNLGSYILSLQNQPLVIDYFQLNPKDKKVESGKSNFFQKLATTWTNFVTSFSKDYDSIGSVYKSENEEKPTINVWISRGKEWAEIMKEMADEDFTSKTGIKINMNVLPAGQLGAGSVNTLMLSITSGKAPDVALGVAANSPTEFAFRDAVVDLTKFSDYKSIAQRFYPSIMVPYEYNKGIYALPETMDFTVMYYRKDIMKELGLKLPNTWSEVYEDLLPRLYENGMQFNYLSGLAPLLFQNGGTFYNAKGTTSGLDSPEAFKAFKDWTEMNTNYAIPVESNFFTRMRSGEMPIGVASYSHYMQLSTSAPELYGRWDIAPVPGTKRVDGTIDRSVSTIASQAAIIMKQSKHQEESWEFLKWWTSAETQMRFGRELEALLGVEARWNTANKEAFQGLPWKKEHLKVIMDQLKWAKEQPIVLGGYFTTRHITNAWNRVVLSNVDPRDSLEQAVKDINKELRTKQEEYGYKPE